LGDEGNLVNVSDSEALFLALKTNLMREAMSEIEQGRVLHRITQEYGISAHDLSLKLGKGKNWVSQRIKLALNLHPDVAKALEAEKISTHVAEIISTLDLPSQRDFLIYLSDNNITNENEVRKAKKRFLNNTIYTIGYEGKELKYFIKILKDNAITYLYDINCIKYCAREL
jgi:ParB-like chromosome segregation protein Spo0J